MMSGRKQNVLLLTFFCALFVSCSPQKSSEQNNSNTQESSSAPVVQNLTNIDGFWVSEKYLAALKTNKAPFNENPETLEIDTKGKKLKWTNFHEGYARHIFEYRKENDFYMLKVSEPESSKPEAEVVRFSIEGEAIIFNEGRLVDQKNERFIKIPSELPDYANKLILSGRYKDAEGKSYIFTEQGNAIWPELTFDYDLVLDSTEAACPYISSSMKDDEGYPKSFGYKWDAEFLYIFDIVEDGDAPISCAKEPFLKLVRE